MAPVVDHEVGSLREISAGCVCVHWERKGEGRGGRKKANNLKPYNFGNHHSQ